MPLQEAGGKVCRRQEATSARGRRQSLKEAGGKVCRSLQGAGVKLSFSTSEHEVGPTPERIRQLLACPLPELVQIVETAAS